MSTPEQRLDALETRVAAIENRLGVDGNPSDGVPPADPPATHTVVSGETLSGIAARYGLTVRYLSTRNGLANPNQIRVGQVLALTGDPAPPETSPPETSPPETSPPETSLPAPTGLRAAVDPTTGVVTLVWAEDDPDDTYLVSEHQYQGRRAVVGTEFDPTSARGPLEPGLYGYAVARVRDGRTSPDSPIVAVVVPQRGADPEVDPAELPPAQPGSGAPVTVGRTLVLDARAALGEFRGYSNMQNRDRNGPPRGYSGYPCRIVPDPKRGAMFRFELRRGDVPDFGGGERTELRAVDTANVREGDERWYEFSAMFPTDLRGPAGARSGGHFIVMQWHSGSGSPPLHLSLDSDANLLVWHRWDSYRKVIGKANDGVWHDYVLHARFGRGKDAFVEVYRDGHLAVPPTYRPNMASAENYFKLGFYRASEPGTAIGFQTGVRITKP